MPFHKITDQDNIPLKLPSLHLKCNIIERENLLKFLGVIPDEHLICKKHIQLIENKVLKDITDIFKTCKLINYKRLKGINYANIAWAITNKSKLKKKLVGKQKQYARIVFNSDRFTVACPLLKTLNSLDVYRINFL